MPITVFNADDHPMLKNGVSNLLRETDDMQWLGSASDGQEAYDKIVSLQPDVAILDIEMPEMSGLDTARKIIKEGGKTAFVLLTLFKDESFFRNAMKEGIKGYLLKESAETEILDCIRSVDKGVPYVNASLTKYLIQDNAQKLAIHAELSNHELNILKLIAREKTTNEIAEMMFISPKTVGNHRSNIGKKLKLSGEQNGLLKWALKHKDLL